MDTTGNEVKKPVINDHLQKKGCTKLFVPKDCCYVDFQSGDKPKSPDTATSLRMETIRGEMIVLDLTKDGIVLGLELIAPGQKPCQPLWTHSTEEEKETK